MLSNDVLEQHLQTIEGVTFVQVTGDGYHYHLLIVSDAFEGQSKVKRQQWVYSKLADLITSGRLHALNMRTLTQSEWEKENG